MIGIPQGPSGRPEGDPDHGGLVVDGLVVVDKDSGLTSHDVVARCRRLAGTKKVGHAGTLDPLATGVLLLGVGRATRLLGHLALTDKDYVAGIRLGVSTATDDAEGEVTATTDASAVTDDAISAGLAALTGEIDQVPSSYSAVSVGGVRAYAAARAGTPLDLPARRVTVRRLDLTARDGADLTVQVSCSTGTYVRALARDLGAALGVGAHLVSLRRTRVGPFVLAQARTLAELGEQWRVVPLAEAVAATFPRRDLDEAATAELRYGRPLPPTGIAGPVGAFGPDGAVLALVEDRDELARPLVVFAPA